MIKSDSSLQADVIEELTFDPAVEDTNIGVTAKDGVVTLSGTVRSYPEKIAAEQAAKRVAGVRGIAEELKIEISTLLHRSDADIARAALTALDWNVTVPKSKVTAKVENGWLTLEGQVDWSFQRDAARRAVEHIIGVHGVTNAVTVKPLVSAVDVKTKVRQAFERYAEVDASKVQVQVENDTVTLRGDVHSWNEHDEASYAAAAVPGVHSVHNYTRVV